MIKIEFPAHDRAAAAAIGLALQVIGSAPPARYPLPETTPPRSKPDTEERETSADIAGPDVPETTDDEVDTAEAFAGEASADDGEDTSDQLAIVSGALTRIDAKGVPFDKLMCGKAADPFYGSGKRKGQWKKRKGVGEDQYDEWYASELELIGARRQADTTQAPAGEVDTASAFGQTGGMAGSLQDPPADSPALVPASPGEFMTWCSEQQAAENLTADDLGRAYAAVGVTVTDLFGADEATVTANVQALYAILAPIAATP